MAKTYTLNGEWSAAPTVGVPTGEPSVLAPLRESIALSRVSSQEFDLSSDSAVSVNLNGLTEIHVLSIKTVGGKVRAQLTSADGTTQSVPVDSVLVLISSSVPVTALTLTRVAGTSTKVHLFMGER